jgi:hypothetical protein
MEKKEERYDTDGIPYLCNSGTRFRLTFLLCGLPIALSCILSILYRTEACQMTRYGLFPWNQIRKKWSGRKQQVDPFVDQVSLPRFSGGVDKAREKSDIPLGCRVRV